MQILIQVRFFSSNMDYLTLLMDLWFLKMTLIGLFHSWKKAKLSFSIISEEMVIQWMPMDKIENQVMVIKNNGTSACGIWHYRTSQQLLKRSGVLQVWNKLNILVNRRVLWQWISHCIKVSMLEKVYHTK